VFITVLILLLFAFSPFVIGFVVVKLTEGERSKERFEVMPNNPKVVKTEQQNTIGQSRGQHPIIVLNVDQNKSRQFNIKRIMYILFGLAPVISLWSIFGLGALAIAPPLGVMVFLGIFGMYRVIFSKENSAKSQITNCLLLLFGQLLLISGLFSPTNKYFDESFEYIIFICFVGPMFVSLHYQINFVYQYIFKKTKTD